MLKWDCRIEMKARKWLIYFAEMEIAKLKGKQEMTNLRLLKWQLQNWNESRKWLIFFYWNGNCKIERAKLLLLKWKLQNWNESRKSLIYFTETEIAKLKWKQEMINLLLQNWNCRIEMKQLLYFCLNKLLSRMLQ